MFVTEHDDHNSTHRTGSGGDDNLGVGTGCTQDLTSVKVLKDRRCLRTQLTQWPREDTGSAI